MNRIREIFTGAAVAIAGLLLCCAHVQADDNPKKNIKIETIETESQDLSKNTVKNPHGFLEFDGTGYHVITRDVKPEKASQVRLKPVESKEHGTVYILEVIDENQKSPETGKTTGQAPHLAMQKVEDLDTRKGVAPEPKRETKADIGVGVKVSESSELLFGRGLVLERKEDKTESRDDGWRFRFKTNF